MSDVVLINPPLTQEERYGKLAPFGNHLPNLGLAYLAAFLRDQGITVQIIDAALHGYSIEKTAKLATERLPLIVGLTATTIAVGRAAAVASKIKQFSPDTNIVLGGAHITAVPEETLETYRSFDFGVIGEGENTLYDLFLRLQDGKSPDDVPGIIGRNHGEFFRTAPRPYIPNIDHLPMPAWDLLPNLPDHYRPSPQSFKRLPSTILTTSRGCPWRCAFCDRSVFGQKHRAHSPARIFEMMKYLAEHYGIKDISFHDELFILNEKRLIELCQHITRNQLDITWSCQGRADLPITDYSLRMMKEAGCWQLQFGVESGSDEILRRMQKDLSVAEMRDGIARASAAGLRTKAFIILGYPGETEATISETEDFILSADLDDVMIGFFTPFPGTEVRKDLEKYGTMTVGYDKQSDHFVAFLPHGLTEDALIRARNRLYRRFYLRPKSIRRQMNRLKEPSSRSVLLAAARRFLGATR